MVIEDRLILRDTLADLIDAHRDSAIPAKRSSLRPVRAGTYLAPGSKPLQGPTRPRLRPSPAFRTDRQRDGAPAGGPGVDPAYGAT